MINRTFHNMQHGKTNVRLSYLAKKPKERNLTKGKKEKKGFAAGWQQCSHVYTDVMRYNKSPQICTAEVRHRSFSGIGRFTIGWKLLRHCSPTNVDDKVTDEWIGRIMDYLQTSATTHHHRVFCQRGGHVFISIFCRFVIHFFIHPWLLTFIAFEVTGS